jgi:hypothetical protein
MFPSPYPFSHTHIHTCGTWLNLQDEASQLLSRLSFFVGLLLEDFTQLGADELDNFFFDVGVTLTWKVRVGALWKRLNAPRCLLHGSTLVVPCNEVIGSG